MCCCEAKGLPARFYWYSFYSPLSWLSTGWRLYSGDIFQRSGRAEDALEAYQSGLDIVRDSGDEASLAQLGYSRDGKKGTLQIVFGLLHQGANRRCAQRRDPVQPFLAAQLLDVAVFDRLRGGRWWRAPLVSSLIGSALDAGAGELLAAGSAAGAGLLDAGEIDRQADPAEGRLA